ncbi:MAG TPA: hypothetical protein VFV64_08885, partial [Permianibacter sp.]|nr:hypothetical protein [Permianibacter sp.]
MNEQSYAVEALRKWYAEHKYFFDSQSIATEWREVRGVSAGVNIDSPMYVAQVTAWDHASCLDVFVADIRTDRDQ